MADGKGPMFDLTAEKTSIYFSTRVSTYGGSQGTVMQINLLLQNKKLAEIFLKNLGDSSVHLKAIWPPF